MFQDTTQPRRALVIGLNYKHCGVSNLNGCINDTKTVEGLLKENSFTDDDIVIRTDADGTWGTHKDIVSALSELVEFGKENPDALLWFSFSGHGGQTQKSHINTDEVDYKNEGLIPTDWHLSGPVTDNQLYCQFAAKLPATVKLFALIDACHSGSMLDLPLMYRSGKGKLEGVESPDLAEVLMISGCMDAQYSADAYFAGSFEGALTFSFARAFHAAKELTYNLTAQQLIPMLVSYLRSNNFDQKPTLSFTWERTLTSKLFNDRMDFNPNTYIEIKGDQWAQFETQFSVYSDDEDKALLKDEAFQLTNETIKVYLQLQDGNYSLRLRDAVYPGCEGDGGVQAGRICFMDVNGIRGKIKEFDLSDWNSSFKTVHFKVDSSRDVDVAEELVEVEIDLESDYWYQELIWNIEDVRGADVFKHDRTFLSPFSRHVCKHSLPKGLYILKLRCSYGDGGVIGKIRLNNENIKVINWRNLDWRKTNGYLKYVRFEV